MEQIKLFSARGHDVLLEYDPAAADMDEVNETLDKLEARYAGRAFSMCSGEPVETVTPETKEVVIVQPIAGG